MYITLKSIDWNLDLLQETVTNKYLSDDTKNLLQEGIRESIKECVIEYPYIDKDFRDSYYNDFSKRFHCVNRNSYRIHLFGDIYYGFFTLRETPPFNIGRTYLFPKACKHTLKGFYCLSHISSNVNGHRPQVMSFPWMQQDTNSSICAHIASWSILRYLSLKKNSYPEVTLYKVSMLSDGFIRKVPSKGLTVEQIAQTLTRAGHSTEVYNRYLIEKSLDDDTLFNKICYSMIESGIPFVAGLLKKQHAITLLGHGTISIPEIDVIEENSILDIADYIDYYISNDDNFLPFLPIKGSNLFYKNPNNIEFTHSLDDIDTIVVPLHEKMYLDIIHIYSHIVPLIEKYTISLDNRKLLRRVFLTSSNSLKKFLFDDEKSTYNEINLRLEMPQFIWIVEYFEIISYNEKICIRFILDATGMVYRELDDILISSKIDEELKINFENEIVSFKVEKTIKSISGNLKEIS